MSMFERKDGKWYPSWNEFKLMDEKIVNFKIKWKSVLRKKQIVEDKFFYLRSEWNIIWSKF